MMTARPVDALSCRPGRLWLQVHLYLYGTTKLHSRRKDRAHLGGLPTGGRRVHGQYPMALPDLPRLGSEATKHCDLQGSDLMPVLFFCKDDDQQTPRAMHWGRGKRRDLWRVWARYRMFGESDNGPASQATSTSMGSSPLPLDSCSKSTTRYGAKSRPSAQWAVHPCALMDHQVAVVLVGMYDEGSWLGLGGRRACSNRVFPTRARGGVRDKSPYWLPLPDGRPEDAGFTVLGWVLGNILPLPYCAVVPCLLLQKHPCQS
ncbi:hypothetical protein FHL15_005409 [Xylaria flabelliformis]|uniref:Uncharacterized protein n=1 Tax=Xylaria flabelliformis TaxID=2512241 RepID=A0A553I0J7_9PEZI|nr:hypothetical protein FHL15_005409 [Xylaria flabelliformis]